MISATKVSAESVRSMWSTSYSH